MSFLKFFPIGVLTLCLFTACQQNNDKKGSETKAGPTKYGCEDKPDNPKLAYEFMVVMDNGSADEEYVATCTRGWKKAFKSPKEAQAASDKHMKDTKHVAGIIIQKLKK